MPRLDPLRRDPPRDSVRRESPVDRARREPPLDPINREMRPDPVRRQIPLNPAPRESPLGWLVRVALVAELLFGLIGASALVLAPDQTELNFAWALKPTPMAATLGAFYLASGGMLLVALFARGWEQVRSLVLPAAIVTAVALVSTLLHWDRFARDTPAFSLWLISYLLPPPAFTALFVWKQRRALPFSAPGQTPSPAWFRRLCLVNGAALAAAAGVVVVAPQLVLSAGPWSLTALGVRVIGGWFMGMGVLLVLAGLERAWERARIATLWPLLMGPILLVQLGRFANQVDWTNAALLLICLDCLLLGAAIGWMWAASAWRVAVGDLGQVEAPARTRRLAELASVCVGAFLVALVALPLLRPDLDVLRRWVGEYASGPYGGLMNLAYVALGVGAEALALGLARAGGGRLGPACLGVAGLGAFMSAILLQDPTDGSPGTFAGTLRQILLMPTFLSLTVALLSLSRRFGRSPEWQPIARAALGLAIVAPLVFAVVVVAPPDWKGLAGRVFDFIWTTWLLLVALRLHRITAAPRREIVNYRDLARL
jgi:hypothetical protein